MDKVTIAYGSENFLYVRVYKKDPTDDTVGVNACIVEPMNMGGLEGRIYGIYDRSRVRKRTRREGNDWSEGSKDIGNLHGEVHESGYSTKCRIFNLNKSMLLNMYCSNITVVAA